MRQVIMSVLATLVVVVLIAALTFAYLGNSILNIGKEPVVVEVETSNTEIIKSIQRDEQIILLSTATQGLHTVKKEAKLWDRLPLRGDRTNIIQYTYTMNLGIEGRDVSIRETGDKSFTVTIPAFQSLGFDDAEFKTVLEDNQILSFVSEPIDNVEEINEILNDNRKQEHIDSNRDLLQDQARNFYTGIIHAIDDDVQLDFKFR